MFVKNKYKHIKLSNVYYISELDENLITFGYLKKKCISFVLSTIFYELKIKRVTLCLSQFKVILYIPFYSLDF